MKVNTVISRYKLGQGADQSEAQHTTNNEASDSFIAEIENIENSLNLSNTDNIGDVARIRVQPVRATLRNQRIRSFETSGHSGHRASTPTIWATSRHRSHPRVASSTLSSLRRIIALIKKIRTAARRYVVILKSARQYISLYEAHVCASRDTSLHSTRRISRVSKWWCMFTNTTGKKERARAKGERQKTHYSSRWFLPPPAVYMYVCVCNTCAAPETTCHDTTMSLAERIRPMKILHSKRESWPSYTQRILLRRNAVHSLYILLLNSVELC
ncbi:unnamed protein product [Trichogramma brassicae]|uniref:Uncharacterized protein n=1 Tax=Trichogramma brassicae TaxID=86971 RepID=A0A6H5IRY6_9HYME|nr:unnamed protein product [Trichogramma brassicae]